MAALSGRLGSCGYRMVAGSKPICSRHPIGRCWRTVGCLRPVYRSGEAARRRPRPHFRSDVPDPRFDSFLGIVRTSRLITQSVHRPSCRSRRGASFGVSVDQRNLHCTACAIVCRALDMAWPQGNGTFNSSEVRSGYDAARHRFSGPYMGCKSRWHGKRHAGNLYFPDLSVPYDWRALPVACRSKRDESLGACAYGELDYGNLVLRIGNRQLCGRTDCICNRVGKREWRRRR